jgi:hypothetical protein
MWNAILEILADVLPLFKKSENDDATWVLW